MSFTRGWAKTGGRGPGSGNKRTIVAAAPKTYPDALDYLAEVMAAKDDPLITPDLRLRAAIELAAYQHPKPAPSKAAGQPIDLEPPKSAEEAREAIARITSMIAKTEIDGEHGGRIIAGLETFLSARAAEQQKQLDRLEDALRAGEP